MAQLSRPYQIVLGAVALLGLVWMVALRGHSASPSESQAPAPTPVQPAKAVAEAKAGAPTPVYHGAAPGVEGLTRAIAKAHGAVATSQRNAQQLERKSGEASNEKQASPGTSGGVAAKAAPGAATKAVNTAAATRRPETPTRHHVPASHSAPSRHPAPARHPAVPAAPKAGGPPAAQLAVERELAQGKTVMLLFWDPKSSVDREVRSEAKALVSGSKATVTMHVAPANQVGTFGSITEVVHVYETPTILIVNRHGVVSTLTGLTDVFALKQAIREARVAG